ncbi:MAG: T9SS type A sorting domain-containing protein, partial [Bacteroidaceae bacterium]|nr:T9SS type A sorting domain-containing protein [Bacteroidaceae bacterium]
AITLYDATGRVVATQAVRPGATTATINVAALPAGVYIARMGNGATSKIVL